MRKLILPLLIALVGIIAVLYTGVGYNSSETITLVHYDQSERNIRVVSATGFYNKFGSTGQEVYQRTIRIESSDIETIEYEIDGDGTLTVNYITVKEE